MKRHPQGAPAARLIVVATIATIAATSACSIQTIGGTGGDLTLSATFDDVQSLTAGHSVQVSDVRIGTVTDIRLDGFRAKVTMSIQDDKRLPVGTTATVAKTSLLGENYIRLNVPPGADLRTSPPLKSGAVITQTSVQPDLEQVSEKAGPLLAALSGQDLAAVVNVGSAAFAGKGTKLNKLIVQVRKISDNYAASREDLGRTLDGLARLGHTLATSSSELDKVPENVNTAVERLNDDRPRLKTALEELTQLATTTNTRIHARHGARVKVLLDRLNSITASAVRGRETLKAIAEGLLKLIRSPSVTSAGQGLTYVWLAGLLPPPSSAKSTAGKKQQSSTPGFPNPLESLNKFWWPRP